MEKKKALFKGMASAIALYYIISFLLLIAVGAYYKDDPEREFNDLVANNGMFIMFLSINIISSLVSLPVGQRFVRRYDRKSRWNITKALMISLVIVCALFMIGYFQPAVFLLACIFTCAPVLLSHYLTFVIRGIIIRRKHH